MFKYYIFKYYLNALHSIDEKNITPHNHTFTISLSLNPLIGSDTLNFSKIDKVIIDFLSEYKGKYLNALPLFTNKSPTIENIGELFFTELSTLLSQNSQHLIKLDISENPLEVYSVSDRILLPSKHPSNSKKHWDDILNKKQIYIRLIGKGNNYVN